MKVEVKSTEVEHYDRRCKYEHTRQGCRHRNGMNDLTSSLSITKDFGTTFDRHDITVNNMSKATQQLKTNFITLHHPF